MSARRWRVGLSGAVLAGTLIAAPAVADQTGYRSWSEASEAGTATPSGGARAVIDELRPLVEKAEQARAADPSFLRDLRAIIEKYDNPWRSSVLGDRFEDGDYTRDPTWTVTDGRFEIAWGGGLVSRVAPRERLRPEPARGGDQADGGGEGDLATQIFGEILRQATGQRNQEEAEAPADTPSDQAAIHTAVRIPNAMAVEISFRAVAVADTRGELQVNLYQGADRRAGYRLALRPDVPGEMVLIRASGRGTSVIELAPELPSVLDGGTHSLRWTRDRDGLMRVALDGAPILSAADRGFRDAFDGLELINLGGEFAILSIAVDGAGD